MQVIGVGSKGRALSVGLIEPVADQLRLDAASTVKRNGTTVGFIVDSQDVQQFLSRVVRRNGGVQYSVFYGGRRLASTLPPDQAQSTAPDLGSPDDQGGRFGTYKLNGQTYSTYFARVQQGENIFAVADVDDAVFAAQTCTASAGPGNDRSSWGTKSSAWSSVRRRTGWPPTGPGSRSATSSSPRRASPATAASTVAASDRARASCSITRIAHISAGSAASRWTKSPCFRAAGRTTSSCRTARWSTASTLR